MKKGIIKLNVFLVVSIVGIMVSAAIVPIILAVNIDRIQGFDKGPSYKPVVPMKKVTFVNFDGESYLDDYAYLAAVPTAVFNDGDRLFSHPLLFYQDEYDPEEEKELTLNARSGIDYFMEDWMSYSNGRLDKMTLINVPMSKLDDTWKAREYDVIESDNPYDIAARLALNEWSYSDDAVIAVIDEEFKSLENDVSGTLTGTLVVNKDIKSEYFEIPQTNKLNPVFNEFEVPEGYKYVYVRCWYPCVSIKLGLPLPGLESLAKITTPAGDKDLQLYCLYDGDWMQVEALAGWNQKEGMDREKGGSYVYKNGKWRVGVTDIPTKGPRDKIEWYGSRLEVLKSLRKVIYRVDIDMYPGERIPLFDELPFDCRDVTIELTSDNPNVHLGFCLIGPGGEEILSDEDGVIEVNRLGQCLPDESYDLVIYTKDSVKGSFDYEITYSWREDKTESEADSLTDATEGAILASMLNAPLLYMHTSNISQDTIDTLYKLGVNNIYIVNLGDHLSEEIERKLGEVGNIVANFKQHKMVYDAIREITDSNDVVFSTIDPWTPWFIGEQKPTNEISMPGALHLGPAAYVAAHHGTPVLVVDNHPRLSSATVWHTEFWSRHGKGFVYPSVAEMYLTGTRVYDFLSDYGFEKKGPETIITVAGQYDIGAPWDRVFVGRANSGRFMGSPVDTAYWIPRNVFYPVLIFENPALNPSGVDLITGSESRRRNILPWGKGGLKIVKPEQVNNYQYPVLASLIGHKYRLNERMEKYYGCRYQCADGIIPGKTNSFEAIDDGTLLMSTGEVGSFWPDMSTTEVVPFYLERGGYSTAFTTSFDATIDNLNNGVILWIVNSHGGNSDGGTLLFWDPQNKATSEEAMTGYPGLPFVGAAKEPNPWRAYDWLLGSTEEPDTMTIEVHGIIPALLGNPDPKLPYIFRTALDWAPAKKPIMDKIGKIASLPFLRLFAPDWLKDTGDYYDGLIISSMLSKFGCSWYKGTAFDKELDNIHSTGLVFSPCLLAGKYLHLTMIRHGSAFQVLDPWGTSWYSSFYLQTIPRDLALGHTIGEAYTNGISHVGILYIGGSVGDEDKPQWWWDIMENVCFYGDPDLRPYVPGTDYSNDNYWEREDIESLRYDEECSIDGHMPFGATAYPHAKTPTTFWQQYLWVIIALVVIVILVIAMMFIGRRKK